MPQNIEVFAVLKTYFPPAFALQNPVSDINELRQALLFLNPACADVLNTCRFAVGDAFVEDDFIFQAHDTICLIPPSSGG